MTLVMVLYKTNIPRKRIAQPQSQFPHSCVCERFIYSHHRFAYSAATNMWTAPGNIKIAQKHMNVGIGTEAPQFPEKEEHKWDFRCSAEQTNVLTVDNFLGLVPLYMSLIFPISFATVY
jgi:hypothetical protein